MRIFLTTLLILWASLSQAEDLHPRAGWVIKPTDKPFDVLLEDLRSAVRANNFGVVTQAGPTGAAANRGITIPNNRVVGVFNNVYAVRILDLSTQAMIEAPIRFYLTEDAAGQATLSYKTPTFVFTPYMADSIPDLAVAAAELDAVFEIIANAAVE